MNRRDAKLYEQHKSRYVLLGALAVFFALLFAGRLANLQIVTGRATASRVNGGSTAPSPWRRRAAAFTTATDGLW